jgi:cysteine desulfuration protein SufE
MDRYNHLIDMGRNCPLIDEKFKTKNYLISGCQSRVWLHASLIDDKIVFTADSDAVITKGIVNLLIRVFSKQPPEDIIDADISFIDKIGLKEHLSPTRSNGLMSMIKQMKLYALAFKTKAQSDDT